nr:MAG TPA: hypothetical protein [Caudoviricetes sp.]
MIRPASNNSSTVSFTISLTCTFSSYFLQFNSIRY